MYAGPWRRTLWSTALAQVRHVRPVWPGSARDLVAEVYAAVEHDFGVLAPPVALHSPAPEVMAAVWMALRESTVAAGRAERPAKEALAAAVSAANACPYCVTVHGAALNSLVRGDDASAIAAERFDLVADPGVRATAQWGWSAAVREAAAGSGLPFPAEHAPELLAVALTFHYLNRVVNLFLPDVPMPDKAPRRALPFVAKILGGRIGAAARRPHPPGASLALLPDAPLPEDLAWAAGDPAVAGALARAAAAVERAGQASVPASVRALVRSRLDAWDGRPQGMDRGWLREAVAELPAADRPAGRLALLVALASWQIDPETVADFRVGDPDDRALIGLAAWSALTAARAVVSWSAVGPQTRPAFEA